MNYRINMYNPFDTVIHLTFFLISDKLRMIINSITVMAKHLRVIFSTKRTIKNQLILYSYLLIDYLSGMKLFTVYNRRKENNLTHSQ